jgi:hypothetical protein
MRISYNAGTDTLHLILADSGRVSSDLDEGVGVEYDDEGRLTQVRIHGVSSSAGGRDLFRQIVIDGIDPFLEGEPLIIIPRLFKGSDLAE